MAASGIYQLQIAFKLINVNCVTGFHKGDIRPFLVEGQQVGLIKSDVLKQLHKYPEVFCIRDCEYTKQVSNSTNSHNVIMFNRIVNILTGSRRVKSGIPRLQRAHGTTGEGIT